jgi:hypothetical protein
MKLQERLSVFTRPSRRNKKRPTIEELPDTDLDAALESLAVATKENEKTVASVRKRQSSGRLKLVSVAPEGNPAE